MTATAPHDDRCEAEYVPEACAWTPCRCDIRAGAPQDWLTATIPEIAAAMLVGLCGPDDDTALTQAQLDRAVDLLRRTVQRREEETPRVAPLPTWRLSSVADVRRVCRALELTESGDGDEWADDSVHVWAQPNRPVLGASGPWCRQITVDVARPGHYCRVGVVFPDAAARALWHLIEVAREGCDVGEGDDTEATRE